MTPTELSAAINTLGAFCGKRDVPALTQDALLEKYGFPQADVMVLFGGSVLAGGDTLAQAMQAGAAKHYVIVGGAGHTTETLRRRVHALYPAIDTDGQPEAVIFERYIEAAYGLHADYLETASTNCGNNITLLLDLLAAHGVVWHSMILCQDATMQHRMEAVLRKYAPDAVIINYAAYRAEVTPQDGALTFAQEIRGMWTVDRYVELLMGEIPRLTDDADGYGPQGKNFIAHVDVPAEVRRAFAQLQTVYGTATRAANPAFATQKASPEGEAGRAAD